MAQTVVKTEPMDMKALFCHALLNLKEMIQRLC
jgi:hypothetical protein